MRLAGSGMWRSCWVCCAHVRPATAMFPGSGLWLGVGLSPWASNAWLRNLRVCDPTRLCTSGDARGGAWSGRASVCLAAAVPPG